MGRTSEHLRALLLRLGAVLFALTVLRWVFYVAHRTSFPEIGLGDTLVVSIQGLRFDAMTLVIANAPVILLHLLPWPWRTSFWHQRSMFVLFVLANSVVLFLCCIDLPLFGFTGKRITTDIIGQADAGLRELPVSMLRYWWATVVFILSVAWLVVAWRRVRKPAAAPADPWPRQLVWSLPALGVLLLLGRGGWQYQGLSPAHAADHVKVALAPLVTNSAFTFGYSFGAPSLRPREYMSTERMEALAPLAYPLSADSTDRSRNVVILIVESLGREYIAAISGEQPYMPFLDSLCARSLVFTNAFANAEGSSKGTCAILAGIPSFTDEAFMNTAYAGNRIDGLGSRLQEMGYTTAYFHGGLNGEFKFDSFSKASGFDTYYGKDEFGDDRHYDGHWGIYDEEFLQFAAQRMSTMPEPFCAGIFTLTTHDPFAIPARYKGRFPVGTQSIHESLGYTDMAIRRFFERASQEPWFNNTLFIITADHTFKYNDHPAWYMNPAGRFAVPILMHAPGSTWVGRDTTVAQQLDIAPTVLDAVGYTGTVSTMGRSLLRQDRPGRAIIHLGGLYQLIEGERMLLFDGTRTKGLYAYKTDTLFANDLAQAEPETAAKMEEQLKACIQRHADALINNRMVATP
jgi:phosphoglycerol transferase MdoB-like AlkP superfamily enzyme